MGETRRHPDAFRPEEAADYLGLSNTAPLETAEKLGWLRRHKLGRDVIYYRADLDDCLKHIVGEPVPPRVKQKPLRMAGGE